VESTAHGTCIGSTGGLNGRTNHGLAGSRSQKLDIGCSQIVLMNGWTRANAPREALGDAGLSV
jgi:hypothetical protein